MPGQRDSNHIAVILDRLRDAQQTILEQALSDLVPPWCEGIKDDFWQTEAGQELGRALWEVNRHEAMTVAQAIRAIWGDHVNAYAPRYKRWLAASVPLYPMPSGARMQERSQRGAQRWYVLYSDVEGREEKRAAPKSPTVRQQIRDWYTADSTRLALGRKVAWRQFTEETGCGTSLSYMTRNMHELRSEQSARAEKEGEKR